MELNRIYVENCVDTLKKMPDDFLDMTLASPPYDDLRVYNGYELPLSEIIRLLYRKTKPGGVVVWVIGDRTVNGCESLSSFRQAIEFVEEGKFSLHDTMLFAKNNPIPSDCGKRYAQVFEYMFCFSKGQPKVFNPIKKPSQSGKAFRSFRITTIGRNDLGFDRVAPTERKVGNVFFYNVGTSSASDRIAFEHPAIFPEKLAEDQVSTWTNEGDLVYDCFMGSGTTARAAHLLKRNWIGSEISKEYAVIAAKRLAIYRPMDPPGTPSS